MSRTTDANDDATGRRCSRRSVLRGGVGALALATGGGIASAQETTVGGGITTTGAVAQLDQYEDLTGFFLHVEGEASPIEASVADACNLIDWGNEQTNAYDVVVLDRNQADVPQARTTLYLHEDIDVPAGALWVINGQEQCGSGYVGVQIEQIGANEVEAGLSGDISPTSTALDQAGATDGGGGGISSALGPGFGWLAGAAGLLGGGWLLSRRDEEQGG